MLSYMANPQLELVLVMLIVPFIVNVCHFYTIFKLFFFLWMHVRSWPLSLRHPLQAVMFWVVDSLTMRKYKNLKSPEEPFIGSEKKRKKDDDDDVSLLNDENHHGVRQRHLLVKTIIPCLLGLLVLSTENCHWTLWRVIQVWSFSSFIPGRKLTFIEEFCSMLMWWKRARKQTDTDGEGAVLWVRKQRWWFSSSFSSACWPLRVTFTTTFHMTICRGILTPHSH